MDNAIDKKLLQLITSAKNESPYYQTILKFCEDNKQLNYDKLTLIPPLTRNILISNKETILCSNYHYLRKKELELVQTSGSTGQFVEVYWNRQDYLRSNLSLWRKRIKWYGIYPHHVKAEFSLMSQLGSTHHSTDRVRKTGNVLELSMIYMDDNSLLQYYNELNNNGVKWIYSTPGALLLFTEYCRKNNLPRPSSITYIELYGEYVSPGTLQIIRDYYLVPVSIMYGAKEVNGIALQCPDGHLHILDDNVYVEKQGDVILITSLKNYVFPIIRYDIGDVFEIEECNCKYGNGKIVTNFMGREKHLSFIDNNTGITVKALTNIIYLTNALFQYCFLQYNITYHNNSYKILIVLPEEKNSWSKQIELEMLSRINQIIPNHSITISFSNNPLVVNSLTGKTNIVTVNNSNQ